MYKKYRFSVCIPTYDRPQLLDELLNNLNENIKQKDQYQIVISDNASPLQTARIVEKYYDQLNIKYVRNDRNIGMSRNIIASIDHSESDYCILTGDDDRFRDGWFDVLESLVGVHYPDLVISNRFICDEYLNIKNTEQCGPNVEIPTKFRIQNRKEFLNYFDNTISTSGFGYLSNLVIKRNFWDTSINCDFVNSHFFPHLVKIVFSLFREGGEILRVPFETVFARSGTDRIDEFLGVQSVTEFDKIMMHFGGFLSAAKFIGVNDREVVRAILKPIISIFTEEYKEYFLTFADNAGQVEKGKNFLNELKIIDKI